MSISELFSPVKAYTNLNVNSLQANQSIVTFPYEAGTLVSSTGSGTFSPEPSEMVGGILWTNTAGSPTVQLPNASTLNAFLPTSPGNISFKYSIYLTGGVGTMTVLLGSGMSAISSNILTFTASTTKFGQVYTFYRDSPTTFKVFSEQK